MQGNQKAEGEEMKKILCTVKEESLALIYNIYLASIRTFLFLVAWACTASIICSILFISFSIFNIFNDVYYFLYILISIFVAAFSFIIVYITISIFKKEKISTYNFIAFSKDIINCIKEFVESSISIIGTILALIICVALIAGAYHIVASLSITTILIIIIFILLLK